MDGGAWGKGQCCRFDLGKVKTTAQMLALGGMLWRQNQLMEILAFILLYIAVGLTIWSMMQYLNASKNSLLKS